ncbi:MAG: succinylglutamate desuccinylase/aspartoacylase family protein [Gemmatimonadales bacterium]|nr:MAG: succinylglutamate desuccinylase/aspartoacylase family protein [Gemmatimonadales bacterium]
MTHVTRRLRLTHALLPVSALLALLPVPGVGALSSQELPQTWQERQSFRAGPTPFEPLMEFWYELDAMSELVSMQPLTETIMGREMNLIVIAEDPIVNAQDAIRSGKTIVFVAPSVHGNEVSPKEAFQLVARELVAGDLRHVLEDVIVIGTPLTNPDGGEADRRTNEAGYDMNRDYLKLESQEIHAYVTQVMTEWTPDIHVDGHHGGSDPYVITYQGTLNPAADPQLRAYPYEQIFPRIREAVAAEDYAAFDYSGARTIDGQRGWGSTSVEPRKHHVYTGLTNSIGILLETPRNSRRVMRDGQLAEIPEEERYYHQIRGGVLALGAILEVAAERRDEIRGLTTASRMRAIQAGHAGGGEVVLDYDLVNRGNEPVWMPDEDAPGGYALQEVPVWLRYTPTRTTSRPVGYLLPPAMASVVPLLMDHDIAVYRFRGTAEIDAEVYYATGVRTDSYFQGHYLRSVEVEKEMETVEVAEGWFWVPSAQSMGNLITYLMEPETDDNLITWGWTDHVLEETPESVEEVIEAMLQGRSMSELSEQQREQIQERAQRIMDRRQQVPMMRVMHHQSLPVIRVAPGAGARQNVFWR